MKKLFCSCMLIGASFLMLSPTNANGLAFIPSPPGEESIREVKQLFKQLMVVENKHDLKAVRAMMWESSSMLFVSKKTKAEGSYGGYWGTDDAVKHFTDLYHIAFRLDPHYTKEKEVTIAPDVVQTYVPVMLTTIYVDGKPAETRPFILIMEWVKAAGGSWKLATDVAVPIPEQ